MILTTLTTLTILNPNLAADHGHFIIPSYSPLQGQGGADTVLHIILHLAASEACLLPRFAELGQHQSPSGIRSRCQDTAGNLGCASSPAARAGTSWLTHRKCQEEEGLADWLRWHRRAGLVQKCGSVGVSGLNEGRDSLVLPVVRVLGRRFNVAVGWAVAGPYITDHRSQIGR